MQYLFPAIFLILGILIGYKFCAYISGVEFQKMYDQGLMILKTEDGWDGTDQAWKSLAMKVRK